ncbi:hypothetical protein TRSC58_07557 [Trypanosoma rangeli SC58]|uniref:Uncharacterized protein n=1 Tax=Trypanosoma rangeli SC58 TaxID=429131 RepID=A0A061IRV1_TRYRA|nr:hypothetical protein TRSC58_07557 [Trypanosoma rangeli SC58]
MRKNNTSSCSESEGKKPRCALFKVSRRRKHIVSLIFCFLHRQQEKEHERGFTEKMWGALKRVPPHTYVISHCTHVCTPAYECYYEYYYHRRRDVGQWNRSNTGTRGGNEKMKKKQK